MTMHADVLVIGSGIAGLFYTLRVAESRRVVLVTKKQTIESSTNYAQGGIASVVSGEDSASLHIEDTLIAGAGLCHRDVVDTVITEGPALVRELMELGVRFTTSAGALDLGREGGHSRHRIVHAQDLTGKEIERALVTRARAHPNVTILEDHVALELITEHNLRDAPDQYAPPVHCWGAYVLDKEHSVVKRFLAHTTVLSTGGCGCVYLHTTNPSIATGDGIAMAYRAGADIANLEFMQFHPTSLFHSGARSFLISEAVRGHGAILRNSQGERFMERYDSRAELAPRDIVARAIDSELKKRGDECVYLDLRHLDPDDVRSRFPHIYETCKSLSIDITTDQIPVVPAAHYMCGGIRTDIDGRSSIDGLFVCGEAAMTGLHGANRLASNSLLEALVLANRAALATLDCSPGIPDAEAILDWDDSSTYNTEEWVLISHNWDELRRSMWSYVGIVRTNKRLERALHRINLLQGEIEEFYSNFRVSNDLIELRNLVVTAELIVRSALERKESRGLHFTTDYPEQVPALSQSDTVISLFDPE